jgi:hypothetical protein
VSGDSWDEGLAFKHGSWEIWRGGWGYELRHRHVGGSSELVVGWLVGFRSCAECEAEPPREVHVFYELLRMGER